MYYIHHPWDDLTFCIWELGQNVKKWPKSRPKGNLCSGGVTILNPKYPQLSSGDTINHKDTGN